METGKELMSHIYKGMNEESTGVRVKKGKMNEAAIAACLNKHYGFHLVEGSITDDTVKKLDYYEETPERRIWRQMKSRASGWDILYDRKEPYWGWDDPRTKDGRDHVGKYDYFVCLSKNGEEIREVRADRMREIIALTDQEFLAAGAPNVFTSSQFPRLQYRHHFDAYSGVPKLLIFLPPKLFDKSKGEIKFYKMIWD
jgi:hypothetical protein